MITEIKAEDIEIITGEGKVVVEDIVEEVEEDEGDMVEAVVVDIEEGIIVIEIGLIVILLMTLMRTITGTREGVEETVANTKRKDQEVEIDPGMTIKKTRTTRKTTKITRKITRKTITRTENIKRKEGNMTIRIIRMIIRMTSMPTNQNR